MKRDCPQLVKVVSIKENDGVESETLKLGSILSTMEESRKLNETERRYSVHKNEMTTVVHCLQAWRHYLLGSKFVVFTTMLPIVTSSPKRSFLPNGLSRRYAIETVECTLLERIKEGLPHDHVAERIIEGAKEGRTREFWLEGELLYHRGHRLFVPRYGKLRKELMKECHDSKWAGHPRVDQTLAILSEQYYWPHMAEDVQAYVKNCLVCQFLKYATFIPASKVCPAVEAARLFLKHVVKYWGMPKTIISGRDTQFTGRFWTKLFKLMGSSLNFLTAVHPQTDGQTERVNALLEIYLRHYVSANQRDCPKLLDLAQFSYNLQRSNATNQSSFEIVTGQQPLTPSTVVTKYEGPNPSAYNVAKEWHEQHDLARACLHKAGKRTKKWADRKRRDVNFEVGDLVLAKLANVLRHADVHKGIVRRYEGSFRVVKRRIQIEVSHTERQPELRSPMTRRSKIYRRRELFNGQDTAQGMSTLSCGRDNLIAKGIGSMPRDFGHSKPD
ncbi:hypothetical protein F3Y22_tig00116964pilonHSYRG00078 [Hibiscus syriacus]|uniref:Integrase catalytic domain-containing protein n=1 Tax=Hibiscus syriacus TaxID=106335 RepID=A0A6A2XL21_HIBSY|nr:hypothetical protein F3Y22_tig00116964pilonHSYRG00078 [Hibiscus syriacus]